MNRNPAVKARLDLMTSMPSANATSFEIAMSRGCASLAIMAAEEAPAECDARRFIEALDQLIAVQHTFSSANKIGAFTEQRKRRKTEKREAALMEQARQATQPMTPPQASLTEEEDDIEAAARLDESADE